MNIKTQLQKAQEYGPEIAVFDGLARITHLDFFYEKKHKAILNWMQKNLSSCVLATNGGNACLSEDSPIWIYWKQGFENAPDVVKACRDSVKKWGGHPVIELSDDNLSKYLMLPAEMDDKLQRGILNIQFLADWIRISLLEKYGGIWMDATIFMSKPFANEMMGCSFYSNKMKPSAQKQYVSQYRWSSFFLAAGNDCALIKKCKNLIDFYMEHFCKDCMIDYFTIDYLLAYLYASDLGCREIIEKVPFNNPEIYWLGKNILEDYNADAYQEICTTTGLFKLNYRQVPRELAENCNGKRIIFSEI